MENFRSVRIKLLGQTSIEVDGVVITHFRWSRAVALLAFLLLNPGSTNREILAEQLWPDRERDSARQNLRQTLLYLRELLGTSHEEILEVTRQSVALNPDRLKSDIGLFLQPPSKIEDPSKSLIRQRQIVDSYDGSLLPNFGDEWLIPWRAQMARTYFDALIFLAKNTLDINPEESLALAEAAIREEPYEDSARATKILALKRLGREAAAQREFVLYATFLKEQLSLQPGKLVASALRDETPVNEPKLLEDRSNAVTATIAETLDFMTEQGMLREASELALALVPFWIRRGSPTQGQQLLLRTFAQADRKAGDVEKLSLARLAFAQGDSVKARSQAEEIRKFAASDYSAAESNLLLARLDLREMKAGTAIKLAITAVRTARKLKDEALELECWLAITMARFSRDQFTKVDRAAARAMRLADRIGDHLTKKSAAVYQAYAFQRLGQLSQAESILDILLDDLSPANSIVATQILCSGSRLMEDLGKTAGAKEMYRLCIEDCKRLSNLFTLCVVQTYLGDLQAEDGEFDESLKLHLEALKVRREFNQNLGIATSLRGIGKALLGKGRPSEARVALLESSQRFRDDDATSGHASSQLMLAEAEAKCGNLSLAERLAENSLDILRGLGSTGRLTIGPSGVTILERGERLLKSIRDAYDPDAHSRELYSLVG